MSHPNGTIPPSLEESASVHEHELKLQMSMLRSSVIKYYSKATAYKMHLCSLKFDTCL